MDFSAALPTIRLESVRITVLIPVAVLGDGALPIGLTPAQLDPACVTLRVKGLVGSKAPSRPVTRM